jgi:futalosine hydrolase
MGATTHILLRMTAEGAILVVVATPRELAIAGEFATPRELAGPRDRTTPRERTAPGDPATPAAWRTLCCGVGPVEAAAATGAALAAQRPAVVLHVGIAGARRAAALPPGTIVIGSESRYSDLAVPAEWAPARIPAPATLIDAARRALPDAVLLPIGTSARVGGSTGCDVEAMEGFGVLRAAQLAGVPAIEVRVVSNIVEEPDRRLWRFDDAFAAVAAITPRLVAAITKRITDA